ncbi:VOC family protein [Paenibacillus methanolicus]|uniref:PhnB protein n=1 Tax=Paenibacillus methanolicus TaxID=582686 RepID=A0A5S5CJC5_9BACL|nr:VOC family protein [Paenibacillus methanolicus]TYP79840.1 PhnB protein [Paenibacillus methanolicus]
MAVLRAYIFCDNAREQAEYYARVLKGKIGLVETYGDLAGSDYHDPDRVEHLELHAVGAVFYLADMKGAVRGNAMDLTLEFESDEEAGDVFEALAEGSSVLVPFTSMHWGRMYGRLVDRYGVGWMIATSGQDAADGL